jgi:D-alanyl-D-alanine carboxypeptidase
MAATAVAVPGTSEHELGLAADIYSSENMSLDESQVDTFTQQWLMEHCWEYGFVLRYPKDKNEITGIIFEPWHYRYVGKEHAEIIHKAGICLEEYLDQAEHEYSPLNPFDEPREEDDE